MTEQEIQAVIDKGGFLVSYTETIDDLTEIHFNNLRIKKGRLYFDNSRFLSDENKTTLTASSYVISSYNWREATPEEVEKYVPKQYRK